MDNKKNGIPKLRFPGFTGAWEQRKLGEVVERFDNLRIPVTSSKREKGITPYYGANGIQDYVQGYTHDGEFVLVAEDGANDLQNYPVHYVNGKVWVNNHAHVLQGKNKMVDNLFLVNAIKQIKIETYLVGGSRAKLNADVMMKLPIKVPTFNEQQKIGEYFSKFDTLIALHQRKLEHLQEQKKGLLQKMFPKNGEVVPEVRFPGFTDAWEQRKLGDIAVIFDGTHQTPKYTDSGIKFVSVENIATLETEKYISQKAYENEYSNKQAEKGDILMTRIGNIGTAKIIEKDEPLAYYVTLALLKPQNIDSNFLVWGISSPEVQRNIWKLTLHIAFPKKINLGEINQVTINIPSSSEQKKIGEFFQQLDSLIALHQRKLEHLELMKKGLLQQMFV
ncbi:restriction endonuclease subunit S [Ligilactobacillus salivarius]|uniref:restriction endonuclease subunit S n=1 Tax=Ligilactobacillus salivarius TaxID=1624 RepID=UPI0018A01CB2|nr:restriction endonuclease subunit S [Ligilactobacillus salivarius]